MMEIPSDYRSYSRFLSIGNDVNARFSRYEVYMIIGDLSISEN